MPVRFLTKQQRRLYGRFAGPPSAEQLDRYFSLDEDDLEFARRCRSTADRLSCAVQIGTLRFLGTFLSDPRQVPRNVLNFVAGQLALPPELGRSIAGHTRVPSHSWNSDFVGSDVKVQ